MSTTAPPRIEPPGRVDALIEEARRRARRRRLGFAAALVLAVAAGAVVMFGGSNGHDGTPTLGHGRSQPPAHTQRGQRADVSRSVITGRFVVGMSFSDARHGWLLDARECWGPSCAVEVDATSDGGEHWSKIASIPTCTHAAATCASVFAIRRISERIGVMLADDTLITTDGGHHWTRAHIAGPFEQALASVAGRVYVLSYRHTGCPGPCNEQLDQATVGTRTFSPVETFRSPSQGFGVDLAGADRDLYAIGPGHVAGGGDAYTSLSVSTDLGRSWTLQDDPCRTPRGGEFDAAQVVAAGRYLALLCIPRITTGTAADTARKASIMLSTDAGRTFRRLHPPSADNALEIAVDARGDLALANGVTSGDGPYTYRLAVSYDAGRTWRTAITRRGTVAEHQRTPTLAILGPAIRWTTGDQTLWRSDNAGASWRATTPP